MLLKRVRTIHASSRRTCGVPRVLEDRSAIGAVGEQAAQERELSGQGGQHEDTPAVLTSGGRSFGM
jgi:hypothetical protein